MARQPRVSSIIGRSIKVARADAASPAIVRAFLELFERTWIKLNTVLRHKSVRAKRTGPTTT